MTIKFTAPNFFDKILNSVGKKRAYKIPEKGKVYDYHTLQAENFLPALLRPADFPPPPGWLYIEDIIDENSLFD